MSKFVATCFENCAALKLRKMGLILKGSFSPLSFTIFASCLPVLFAFLENTDGSMETILKWDDHDQVVSTDHNHTAQLSTSKNYEKKKDQKECIDTSIKRLQNENVNLKRMIVEKDTIIHKQTEELEGLKIDLKLLDDHSRRLVKKNLNELAEFKAKYFRDQEGNSQLHLAAQSGDEQAVKKLIELGADVNATNINSETPIILAATSEVDVNVTIEIVKYLIEHGADAIATDKEGQTFLHKFASRKSPPTPSQIHDVSEYLVAKNLISLFNIPDTTNGTTPIMLAAANLILEPDTISLLHANAINFTALDKNGKSLLFYVIGGHFRPTQNWFISFPNLGNLIFEEEIGTEDEKLTKLFEKFGADVNETNNNLWSETPLHHAAHLKNRTIGIQIIQSLIDAGADVEARDKFDAIFLHSFIDKYDRIHPNEFHDMAELLVLRNLSRLFNVHGYHANATPFQQAVSTVEVERETLSLLKNNGVDFNAVDIPRWSVLFYAVSANRTLRLISDLVELGANPKHINANGWSMLHDAASVGNVDVVKFFLEQGLDVNAQEFTGETPLHCVLSRFNRNKGHVFKIVQLLLRNGARSDIADNLGETPRNRFGVYPEMYPEAEQISKCFSLGSSC